MNSRSASGRSPRRFGTVLALAIALALIAYQTYMDRAAAPARPQQDPARDVLPESPADRPASAQPPRSESVDDYLRAGPRGQKLSPGGLVYTRSSQGEHRVEHVLRHCQDQPDRPGPHGVFDAQGAAVFRLLDEAYALVLAGSPSVEAQPADADFKSVYRIDLGRPIGFLGGQTGQRQGHPRLSHLMLVLAEDRVITAYPDAP